MGLTRSAVVLAGVIAARGQALARVVSIRAVPDASEARLERLVRSHASAVLAYCTRRATFSDPQEAAAEVFAVAWRRLGNVPEGEEARYWLLGVARRVLANEERSLRRRSRLHARLGSLGEPHGLTPEMVILGRQEDREIIEAMGRLSRSDREILALVVWDEVPRERVAEVLRISVAAVNKRYQRALRRLARMLGAEAAPGKALLEEETPS